MTIHPQIPECRKQWDDDQLRAAKFRVVIGDDIKVVAEAILAITEAAKPNDESDDEQDIWQKNFDEMVVDQDSYIGTTVPVEDHNSFLGAEGGNQTEDIGFREGFSRMDSDGPSRRDSSYGSTSTSTSTMRRTSKRLQEELLLTHPNEETGNRPVPDVQHPDVKRSRTAP